MKYEQVIDRLQKKHSLSEKVMEQWIAQLLSQSLSPERASTLLIALSRKGETAEEVAGAIRAVQQFEQEVNPQLARLRRNLPPRTIDVCGTGGDSSGTFNISTTVAFVVAASGVPVAKHGNRAVSSHCGSSNLLEALGVRTDIPMLKMRRIFDHLGMAYLHAPFYHPAFQQIQFLREKLKQRTIFNLLGPLLNPYGAKRQLIGVYDAKLLPLYGKALQRLGTDRAVIVHGRDCLDEVTLSTSTDGVELRGRRLRSFTFTPKQLGLKRVLLNSLQGGDISKNSRIFMDIITGWERGPKRMIVLVNAAFALRTAGKVETLEEGFFLAEDAIDSGNALAKFKHFQEMTRQ